MSWLSGKALRITLAMTVGVIELLGVQFVSPTQVSLTSPAEARIGRPLTPMSYAGVARRTTRRAYVGAAAGVAGAAAVAGTAYYGSSCSQVVDAYGRVVTRCP
jgi:hypothetical protein